MSEELRDLRDPTVLGEMLLEHGPVVRRRARRKVALSKVYDEHVNKFRVDNYAANPSTLDKYGSPNDVTPIFAEIRVK